MSYRVPGSNGTRRRGMTRGDHELCGRAHHARSRLCGCGLGAGVGRATACRRAADHRRPVHFRRAGASARRARRAVAPAGGSVGDLGDAGRIQRTVRGAALGGWVAAGGRGRQRDVRRRPRATPGRWRSVVTIARRPTGDLGDRAGQPGDAAASRAARVVRRRPAGHRAGLHPGASSRRDTRA